MHICNMTFSYDRVHMVENSALRSLQAKIYANKSALMDKFQKHDTGNTGRYALIYDLTFLMICLHPNEIHIFIKLLFTFAIICLQA